MNRTEYLKQLDKYLKRLPAADYQNAMEYFTEYFDEAGPQGEEQVIRELGTPKEAASELLSALLDEKTAQISPETVPAVHNNTEEYESGSNHRYQAGDPIHHLKKGPSPLNVLLIAGLAILAAPIGVPLALVLLVLLFVGILLLGIGILCVFIFSISSALLGAKMLIDGFSIFTLSLSGSCLLIGAGLLGLGLCILLLFTGIFICRWIGIGMIRLTQKIINKRRGKQNEKVR